MTLLALPRLYCITSLPEYELTVARIMVKISGCSQTLPPSPDTYKCLCCMYTIHCIVKGNEIKINEESGKYDQSSKQSTVIWNWLTENGEVLLFLLYLDCPEIRMPSMVLSLSVSLNFVLLCFFVFVLFVVLCVCLFAVFVFVIVIFYSDNF